MRAETWWLGDRRAVVTVVLAAHAALLWFMQRQLLQSSDQPSVNAARLRIEVWLSPPPAALPTPPALRAASSENKPQFTGRHAGSAARGAASDRKPLSPAAARPDGGDPAPAFASAPAPAEPASAPRHDTPADTTPLLDPAATRRAIRESALGPRSMAQQAVQEGAALRSPTAAARLTGAIERSGKGDCAKGEFAGGGMGLLSLPFLVAAAINGDCAK